MKKLFVLGIAALLLVAFSVPAMAEVKIGGIIFTDFYYIQRNSKNAEYYGHINNTTSSDYSYGNTRIDVPVITRLYGRWTNEDNVGMYIEFGIGGSGEGSAGTAVVLRHAYGWWDVTPQFQIMAGHSTTPFSPLNPSQLLGTNDGSLNVIGIGYGEFYSGRFPQVRATYEFNKMFGLALAVVDPNGGARFTDASQTINPENYTTNTKLPRFDLGAHVNIGPVVLYPSVLWQQRTFDKVVGVPASIDDAVYTYAGSLGLKFGMGPVMLQAEGQYGRNWGNTHATLGVNSTAANSGIQLINANTSNPTLDDTIDYSYWVDLSFKFGPITPHLMFGQFKAAGNNGPMSYESMMYGISCPIQLAKGFSVRPELMWYDDGDNNTPVNGGPAVDNGSYQVFGVQFQITF